MSVLIACIGNIFQGDDAFGCEVAIALYRRAPLPDVRVVDFGIRSLDLTYALLEPRELTILVDAVSRGGEPGTLYTIEPDLEEADTGENNGLDAHAMDAVQVIRLAKSMGARLGRVLLVGCEPADPGGEEGRMGLTAAVQSAVEPAADLVEALVKKERVEVIR